MSESAVREALAELVELNDLRIKYSISVPDSARSAEWLQYQSDVQKLVGWCPAWDKARAALAQSEPAPTVASVTECEACFTPDACQLRGTCDHYAAEQLRVATPPPDVQPAQDNPMQSLTMQMQQMCSDWNTYWRASDAHGVNLTRDQALELLRFALGVEVEIKASQPAQAEPVAWRTEAAAWLRRKATESEPESERTGWANPAHAAPERLRRIADELDAEQEAAPYGIEAEANGMTLEPITSAASPNVELSGPNGPRK